MVFSCKKLGLESRARHVSSASYQQVRGRNLEQPATMQWPKANPAARLSWGWWEHVAIWKCYLHGYGHWEQLISSPLYWIYSFPKGNKDFVLGHCGAAVNKNRIKLFQLLGLENRFAKCKTIRSTLMGQVETWCKMVSSWIWPLRTADIIPIILNLLFSKRNNNFVLEHSGTFVNKNRI